VNEKYILLVYLVGSLLLVILALSLTASLIIYKQRQAKHKLDKFQLEYKHQTDLLHTRLDVQEQSMSLISGEIHDHVGPLLSLTQMYLHTISAQVTETRGAELMKRSKELVGMAIDELRHISHSLNSDLIQKVGLVKSLERELEYLENTGLHTSLEVSGTPRELTREQDLLIYRIVQESIQNVLKHAEAKNLVLRFAYSDQFLSVQVQDDGKGFDPVTATESHSLGLRNINIRAGLLGGKADIESQPDQGSLLRISIPLNA